MSLFLLELHNWSTFGGHFRLLKLLNIKNIFFPKIHWVLSVKSHLSPVKIFPSTAFLYKALITQFAESALEMLRSEAWRIFFSFKRRERKEKEEREERRSSLSKIFIVMSTWLHLLWAYREKRKKKGARRKRRKKGRGSWEWKGEIKGKQKFHPKPGILQAVIFQLIEKPLNKKSSLENRKCCDYKVEHFISTNWSLNVLWESNCSVQLEGKNTTPHGGGFFFPFGLSQHFSFFLLIFFFGTAFFSQPSEQVLRCKPNSAMPSWWLHASKAECSRWKPFPPPLK